jgi:hypothetical protein
MMAAFTNTEQKRVLQTYLEYLFRSAYDEHSQTEI